MSINDLLDNIGILDPEGLYLNPLTNKPYSENYKKLAKVWSNFPAYKEAKNIIQDIVDHQVLLIISATGSGKTVLIPKYVLHALNYDAKIAITLPKQIIAKSAAEFSAKTLDVELGNEVGYQYKGENKSSKNTKLLYATDGTIIVKLLNDPKLSTYDAVIMDEIHERKPQIDLLLFLLRNTLKMRPEFKLILMSATVDDKLFESYYFGYKFKTIRLEGAERYKIEYIFLEKPISDKEYIEYGYEIIKKIDNTTTEGDILFFVTSVNETQMVCDKIRSGLTKNFCVEVFAGMKPEQQELAQDKDKYKSITNKNRKIVIATNVAESSLTIPNIKYVINSGYELTSYYDPELRVRVLEKKFASQAQNIQRCGRTGRTGPGYCYHLYTKDDFENRMSKFPEPSIRTSNIYDECLRFLHLPNVRNISKLLDILSNFIEPPREIYIRSALTELMRLGLVQKEEITPLGDLVAELQIDPMQGIGIILGYELKCSKEITAIFSVIDASKKSIGELFHKPSTLKNIDTNTFKKINEKYINAKKKLFNRYGDHLSILKIFILYTKYRKKSNQALEEWCYKHFLKKSVLDKAYKYYEKKKIEIKRVISKYDLTKVLSIDTMELEKLKLEYKIMVCIVYGFRLNIDNIGTTKYKINRDSFMNYIDRSKLKGNIVYDELFSSGGRIEFNIVSRLSKKIYKLLDKII